MCQTFLLFVGHKSLTLVILAAGPGHSLQKTEGKKAQYFSTINVQLCFLLEEECKKLV